VALLDRGWVRSRSWEDSTDSCLRLSDSDSSSRIPSGSEGYDSKAWKLSAKWRRIAELSISSGSRFALKRYRRI
jgi:hypothetical protein